MAFNESTGRFGQAILGKTIARRGLGEKIEERFARLARKSPLGNAPPENKSCSLQASYIEYLMVCSTAPPQPLFKEGPVVNVIGEFRKKLSSLLARPATMR
jgi:hypothetical protein